MDALDVLDVGAEVGRVVDLVLEEDAGDPVADELRGLDCVVLGVEVVGFQGAGEDGELEVSSGGMLVGWGSGRGWGRTYLAAMLASPTVCPHILMA